MKNKTELIVFNGIEAIELSLGNGARAIVSRLGAQVLSWKPRDGRERLFLSEKAVFDGSRSIRGGIPVCFPQFSALGKLPKHGFVRTREWAVDQQRCTDEFALVCLALDDDEAARALWPHPFRAELTVVLEGDRLDVELAVENRGSEAFSFTGALHSYLRVKEVEEVGLQGLAGIEYRDALEGDAIRRQSGPELTLEGPIDRVYHNVSRPLLMGDRLGNLGIHGDGFSDVVVWNPWVEGAAALPDMAPLDFRHMLCVEAAAARVPIIVPAGETWFGRQTLAALSE